MKDLDRQTARQIIIRLKAGTSPLEYVEHLNVGNQGWYDMASEYFDDLEGSNDSLVRFIKGYYGDGKTHFLGMLRALAFRKNWAVTYVTAEKTPLNRFDTVYSEIVSNLTLPPNVRLLDWVAPAHAKGPRALLAAAFSRICSEAYPPGDRTALTRPEVIHYVKTKSAELSCQPSMAEVVGRATRGYMDAVISQDAETMQATASWLQGDTVKVRQLGISRAISRLASRDAMRSIAALARRAGLGGTLVLFDEAERIMKQSAPTRSSSYGIIRDLVDNADHQGGMESSIMYIAATPEMFSDRKGFPENDALRSRLEISARFASSDYPDYRSVIVDLTRTPLSHDLMLQLADRITQIHGTARDWSPQVFFTADAMEETVRQIEQGGFHVSKPRMLASSVATLLDAIEQNRQADVLVLIDSVLDMVHDTLPKQPATAVW